jgi:hypothetical protein
MAIGAISSNNSTAVNDNDPQAEELFAAAWELHLGRNDKQTATSTGVTNEGWPTGTANSLVVKRDELAACGVLVRQAVAWSAVNLPANYIMRVGVTVKAEGLPKGNKAVKAWVKQIKPETLIVELPSAES